MHQYLLECIFWCAPPTVARQHLLDYMFWCAAPFVMTAIAAYMLRGSLQREFPSFFNFVVFQIAAFAVEFPLRNWGDYFYVYWVITTLGVFVSFAVVVEIVEKIAERTKAPPNWNLALLCWCALASVAVIAMWPFSSSFDGVTNGIFLVDRTVRVTQFGLAFFLVMFGASMGISKRSLVFGIAVGFGFFAAVNLLVMALCSQRTSLSKATLSRLDGFAYVLASLTWLIYMVVAAKEHSSSRPPSAA
jgi:hypothetical protein